MSKAWNLAAILEPAKKRGFAVGSFSCRYIRMIQPILLAAQATHSPVIVQVSEKEIYRHKLDLREVSDTFYRVLEEEHITVPAALHLDHTKDPTVITRAVEAGFTSVMIDASEHSFEENVRITQGIVDYAHRNNVCVEAELGKIGTTDFAETNCSDELFTVPAEAAEFCRLTGVDALAVSVGTAHGPYTTTKPTIAYDRLQAINLLTNVPLVLHGASGVPREMVARAAQMNSGGVCKVNIATDLEMAMMEVLGRVGHMSNQELEGYPEGTICKALLAVRETVEEKMRSYLLCAGQAENY